MVTYDKATTSSVAYSDSLSRESGTMTTLANGSSSAKSKKPSMTASAAAAASPAPAPAATIEIVKLAGGKPDLNHHHAQLDLIKAEIDKTTTNLDNVRSQMSGSAPSNNPEGKRRAELNAELDTIRQSQAGNKGARGKILDEVKAVQDSLTAKIKALQASKAKSTYRSPAEIDGAIARLDAQLDSGSLKIVEEKKALSEISNLRKSRKAVEAFATQQSEIDAEREKLEKLRSQLDDPQSKAMSKRFDEIRSELDAIKAKTEKSGNSRQQLMTQRNELQASLDDLWKSRRARQADFRNENDSYNVKVRAEREKRNEKYKEEKKAEEARRRKEEEAAMREDAALPAYGKEIEDCEVLIRYFAAKTSGGASEDAAEDEVSKKKLEGVKPLELRKIEADDAFAGAKIIKKKGEDAGDDGYFVGGAKKSKGKGKKKGKGVPLTLGDDGTEETNGGADSSKEAPLNIPLPMLSGLLALNIPPPTGASDVGRVIDNLRLKKSFFLGDQKRKTQENIDALEKKLKSTHVDADEGEAAKPSNSEAPTDS